MTMSRETVDHFILKDIRPIENWQAVYYGEGTHQLGPVYALALAYRRTRDTHTGAIVPPRVAASEDELWEIVGLYYDPGEGWIVWDERSSCCGLLPPDMSLAEFEARCPFHTHYKQTAPDDAVGAHP
jgi:hypothetical protein